MKKNCIFWMGVLFLTIAGLSSCSSDDSDSVSNGVVYESNPRTLNGTWHMVSASYGFGGEEKYQPGETTVTFNEAAKTINVENKKNVRFLKSGSYPYDVTTEKRSIYTYQWVEAELQVMVIHYNDEEGYGNCNLRYFYGFQDGMLVLDGGMASDGPGFYFKKPK